MKYLLPILTIIGGALYIRHCIKDAQHEGEEVRVMVVTDPSGLDEGWVLPDVDVEGFEE